MPLPAIVAVATKLGIEVAKYIIKKQGKKVLKEGAEKQLKKQVAKQTSQAKRDIRRESSDRLETGLFRMQQDSLRRTKPKTALRHQRRAESNSRQNQKEDSTTLIIAQGKKKTAKFLKENVRRGFKPPKNKPKSGLGIKDK
tara:strand:- start:72 stop:494 length:423 start_codon:yes stop_codon:yes gene_type:complete